MTKRQFEKYRRLALKAARSYRLNFESEDVAQEAYLGLNLAIKKYKKGTGMTLSGYIYKYVRWHLSRKFVTPMTRKKNQIHIEGEDEIRFSPTSIEQEELENIAAPHAENDSLHGALDSIEQMTAGLTEQQRRVVTEYCGGKTYQQIADAMGVTRQRIEQIWKKSLRRLRGQIDDPTRPWAKSQSSTGIPAK